MKKSIFFALGLAAVMASCSSDEIAENGQNINEQISSVEDANGDMAVADYRQINLGLSNAVTRGNGMVGGFEGNNKWNGETLYIYMMKHGTMTPATFVNHLGEVSKDIKLYNNTPVVAPVGINGDSRDDNKATCADGAINYYPMVGDFDFYGYHIDDAANGTPTVGNNNVTVPFKIDGSQDLMTGVTNFANDKDHPYQVNGEDGDGNVKEGRTYSAHAARHGVQPTLNFSHKLTRLTFVFAPGNAHAAGTDIDGLTEGIRITAVDILSPSEGTMTVASLTADEIGNITWSGNLDSLSIPKFTTIDLADKEVGTFSDDSEGIMLKPVDAGDSIQVVLHIAQKVKTNVDGTKTEVTTQYPFYVKVPDTGLVAGTSYKVKVTVYGLEDVQIHVTLEPWKQADEDLTYDEEA